LAFRTYVPVKKWIKANKDKDGNWHHYWEDNMLGGAFRHTGVHDGDYEYNITLLLADKHKIMLYREG
ncbi:hypothetical protein cypCar_00045037, partial [Cyprinus carpio]